MASQEEQPSTSSATSDNPMSLMTLAALAAVADDAHQQPALNMELLMPLLVNATLAFNKNNLLQQPIAPPATDNNEEPLNLSMKRPAGEHPLPKPPITRKRGRPPCGTDQGPSAPTIPRQAQSRRSSTGATKRFHCNECEQGFTRSDGLQRHLRLHSGYRPFTCVICGRKFSRSDHCQVHTRRHFIVASSNNLPPPTTNNDDVEQKVSPYSSPSDSCHLQVDVDDDEKS